MCFLCSAASSSRGLDATTFPFSVLTGLLAKLFLDSAKNTPTAHGQATCAYFCFVRFFVAQLDPVSAEVLLVFYVYPSSSRRFMPCALHACALFGGSIGSGVGVKSCSSFVSVHLSPLTLHHCVHYMCAFWWPNSMRFWPKSCTCLVSIARSCRFCGRRRWWRSRLEITRRLDAWTPSSPTPASARPSTTPRRM